MQFYNLFHNGTLVRERATWIEIQHTIAERCYHKDDVDIEKMDVDTIEAIESERHYNEGLEP